MIINVVLIIRIIRPLHHLGAFPCLSFVSLNISPIPEGLNDPQQGLWSKDLMAG